MRRGRVGIALLVVGIGAGIAVCLGSRNGGPWIQKIGLPELSAFQRTKVEWLLANRLPCLGCHVINGSGGRLGPDLTFVGQRLSATAIEAKIANPQATNVFTTMPSVPMSAGWRRSLSLYLSASGPPLGS